MLNIASSAYFAPIRHRDFTGFIQFALELRLVRDY